MEWKISTSPVAYTEAVTFMEARARQIRDGLADELVWLLEHPALFTAGTSANPADLIDPLGLPVYATGRGGQYTYHGPGQRIAYVMLDLKKRGADLRLYVQNLERWVIAALAAFGVEGFIREGRVGVWVDTSHEVRSEDRSGNFKEAKIAALGVRVRQWVSYHGISLNVHPDLRHYRGIVPCGIREYGITSLEALGKDAQMAEVDAALKAAFAPVFG